MWDNIFYFIMVPMVYLSFAVFLAGILFKGVTILSSEKYSPSMAVYPVKGRGPAGAIGESFLVPSAFRKSRLFWFFIIAFHAAFLLLIIGHLELIRDFSIIQVIPHDVFLGSGFVGIVLIVSTVYFLFRRFHTPFREISVAEDYVLLLLLFTTMIFGSHMNLAATWGIAGFDIPVEDYRTYLWSMVLFSPELPKGITYSPHYVILALHIFFANIFLMLFPFSKMIHSVFIFFAQNIKRK